MEPQITIGLMVLAYADDDYATAATSFGKPVCGRPFAGGNSDFQSKSFVSVAPGSHRGVKEPVGQRPRPDLSVASVSEGCLHTSRQ